jgi:hypothetical protein
MFGAFLTFVFIELIVGQREKRLDEKRAIEQEKQRLIRQLRSSISEEATRAIEELASQGGLRDGTLRGAYLGYAQLELTNFFRANLQEVNLEYANLKGARFVAANLQGANLEYANLKDTNFNHADLRMANISYVNLRKVNLAETILEEVVAQCVDLREANLYKANLQNADLKVANLEGADMRWASLKGANLTYAILERTKLDLAKFDERTTLPDGSRWTSSSDMKRFTNPKHPSFYHSDPPYWVNERGGKG